MKLFAENISVYYKKVTTDFIENKTAETVIISLYYLTNKGVHSWYKQIHGLV